MTAASGSKMPSCRRPAPDRPEGDAHKWAKPAAGMAQGLHKPERWPFGSGGRIDAKPNLT
ncbi:hypothetical protein [Olivibacter sitiensis]|uniref:hypothetical protein n=1 Tax=Olivibacter sitiensis TaxID=376470 RepID=UPI0012F7964A|nr:hypothetical protein [Olivibacter sitiensis]